MPDLTVSNSIDAFMVAGARRVLTFAFDAPANGAESMELVVPFALTITGWKIKSVGITGTIELDLWANASATPTSGDTIVASAPPTTSSAFASSSTLTGWTTSLAANDIVICEVVDNGGASEIILQVNCIEA